MNAKTEASPRNPDFLYNKAGARNRLFTAVLGLCLFALPAVAADSAADNAVEIARAAPQVEVVFVLDTTGSMGGLIAGAKEKIWFIAGQIVAGEPTPEVRMGLVAYRDKGDAYVTRVFDLTDNIDQVYTDLMGFQAAGGGDFPENVNQALFDSLHKISWSEEANVLRIIYLVGDAPPHPYEEVPSHTALAGEAARRGILINTIQCGRHAQTTAIWQEIAEHAGGHFFQIDQEGGVRHIPTPFDAEMAELNAKLMETTVVYGAADVRGRQSVLNVNVAGYDTNAAAERAAFSFRSGNVANHDLLDTLRRENLTVADLDEAQLPESMQAMTVAERTELLEGMRQQRAGILKNIQEVSARRDAFLREAIDQNDEARQGFDFQVMDALRRQATKAGIRYE